MPLKKPAAKKTTMPKRTTPRIEDTEPAGTTRKTAKHRGTAQMELVDGRGIRFVGQGSELVPVAQYASVTIGPVLIDATISYDADKLAMLADVDWPDSAEEMESMGWPSDAHRELFEQVVNQGVGIQRAVDIIVARDRALVEESIRVYNEREEEERAAAEKKNGSRSRR